LDGLKIPLETVSGTNILYDTSGISRWAFSVDACRFDHSKIGCDEPKSFMHTQSIADDLFLWSKGLLAANFLL